MSADNSNMGRPKVLEDIDLEKVELFGRFKATHETMADYFEVSVRTVERYMADDESNFCRVYKRGMAKFKLRLSEAQVQSACAGNATMLVWLGKQYLDQKDKQEIQSTVEVTGRPFISFSDTSKREGE